MPYTTTYPTDPYALNPQDETNDFLGPGADAIANAVDYARHDQEIKAIHDDLLAALVAAGGPADIAAMTAAILGGHTDGDIFFGSEMWADEGSGDWAPDSGPNGPVLRRTPNNGGSGAGCALPLHARAAADRGTRVTVLRFVYAVTVAEPAIDVGPLVARVTLNGDGSAPTQAAVVGTFDVDHDSPAKRKTIGEHTLEYTITAPLFTANNTYLRAAMNVDDNGGGTAAVDVRGVYVRHDSVPLDGS